MSETRSKLEQAIREYAAEATEGGYALGWAVIVKVTPSDMPAGYTTYLYNIPEDQTIDVSIGLGTILAKKTRDAFKMDVDE